MERRSWLGAIIANLGTLTIDEVELPIRARSFPQARASDSLAGAVFALLGVPTPPRVQ